jgi:hypothetical protein
MDIVFQYLFFSNALIRLTIYMKDDLLVKRRKNARLHYQETYIMEEFIRSIRLWKDPSYCRNRGSSMRRSGFLEKVVNTSMKLGCGLLFEGVEPDLRGDCVKRREVMRIISLTEV